MFFCSICSLWEEHFRMVFFWLIKYFINIQRMALSCSGASLVAQMVKNLPAMWETQVCSLGREDLLEKRMSTRCSILAWRVLWTEEPGGLMRSQRVRHNWETSTFTFFLNFQAVGAKDLVKFQNILIVFIFCWKIDPVFKW